MSQVEERKVTERRNVGPDSTSLRETGLPAAAPHDDRDPDAAEHRADLLLDDLLGMWDARVADHHRHRIRHHEREAEIHRRLLGQLGAP